MVDAIEKRKSWLRRIFAIFVGLIVTGAILYILPGMSKTNKLEEKKVLLKEVKPVEPVKEDIEEDKSKDNVKISTGDFKRYRITLEVEFNERTEIKKAINDFKKACSIIKSSPSIKKLVPIKAKAIKKKNGLDIEYDIVLE